MIRLMNRSFAARAPLALGAALLMGACSTMGSRKPAPPPPAAAPAPPVPVPDRKFVVVDVERNELRFMDGERVLWRAPVGTGTGFRLSTRSGRQWQFHTPSGTMQVQYKELNPAWFRPDWWFIENKRPVPPQDSPLRKEEGGLGAAAVFLGNELAIHGTDKPELLGRRVSHGCIRLSNANAVRLFHNVQVGTPVMIVGESVVLNEEQPDSVARFTRSARRVPRRPNPLDRVTTLSSSPGWTRSSTPPATPPGSRWRRSWWSAASRKTPPPCAASCRAPGRRRAPRAAASTPPSWPTSSRAGRCARWWRSTASPRRRGSGPWRTSWKRPCRSTTAS
jgi:hypothetical protein